MKLFSILIAALLLVGCAGLSKQVAGMSTGELKLRRSQLAAEIESHHGWLVSDQIEEKDAVERELLHRWQAGDKSAYLPVFGGTQ